VLKLFGQAIEIYKLAFLFLVLAWPIACIPVFFEALQHYAEYKLGMFQATSFTEFGQDNQNKRLVFGAFKVFSIMAIYILLPRFFILGQDVWRAVNLSKRIKWLLFRVSLELLLFGAFVFLIGPWVLDISGLPVSQNQRVLISLLVIIIGSSSWQNHFNRCFAEIIEDRAVEKQEQKSINKALFIGFIFLMIPAVLPAMALHYGLGGLAMGAGGGGLFGILLIDSFVVGVLAALLAATFYVMFRDARV